MRADPPDDLCALSAVEIASRVARRELSPVAVAEQALARTAAVDAELNAFTVVDADGARRAARELERRLDCGGPCGALAGVPVAFKDMTPTRGLATTSGSLVLKDHVPDHSAVVVRRALAADAILIAKTTQPEFAKGGYTESRLWGVTRNPWRPELVPGGSSGGAAVAVATGCVPLAEGSDMGGSIRYPAAFCGTVGFKPSLGRIPMDMLETCFDSMFCFGPLSRSVADAALFVATTQGPDFSDIQSQPATADLFPIVPIERAGLRLAWSLDLGYIEIDPEIEFNFHATLEALRRAGVALEEAPLGWTREVHDAALTLARVWFAAACGDHVDRRRDDMDPRLVAYVEEGRAVDAVTCKRSEFLRTAMWRDLAAIFGRCDALLCPTTAMLPPPIGGADVEHYYDEGDRFHGLDLTCPFNLVSQCPALSLPNGFTADGLPTAIQIVGDRFDDRRVLEVAAVVETLAAHERRWPPVVYKARGGAS